MDIAVDAWLPKSVVLLREYTFERFVADLIAGVTVGLAALPLAIAFAIASGVSPQAGIYCAMVTGFLILRWGARKRKSADQRARSSWLFWASSRATASTGSSLARCLRA